MNFSIAGLKIEVDGMDVLPQQMFNLRPFVSVTDDAAEPICKIKCGCRLATAVGHPSLTSSFDGKTLSLWLLPGRIVVAQRLGDHGTTYHLEASCDWRHVRTDCTADTLAGSIALGDFIMISFIYSSAYHDTVLIHASCVAVGSSAAVFVGPSGISKSTHSNLWLRYVAGSCLLNDDQPALRVHNGDVMVYGTPWSGKTHCYRNESARVSNIFVMAQAKRNEAVRLDGPNSFCALIDMTSLIKSDIASFTRISGTVAAIASRVGIYKLYNRADRDAVETSHAICLQSYNKEK